MEGGVECEEDVLPKRLEGYLWRRTKLGAHARRKFVLDAGVLTYTSPTKREVVTISMDNVKDVVRLHNEKVHEVMLVMFNGQSIQVRAESRAEYLEWGLQLFLHTQTRGRSLTLKMEAQRAPDVFHRTAMPPRSPPAKASTQAEDVTDKITINSISKVNDFEDSGAEASPQEQPPPPVPPLQPQEQPRGPDGEVLPRRIEGSMYRRSRSSLYKKRSFVLDSGVLTYSSPSKGETVTIRLENVKQVEKYVNESLYELAILMYNGQTMRLRAETKAEFYLWGEQLTAHMQTRGRSLTLKTAGESVRDVFERSAVDGGSGDEAGGGGGGGARSGRGSLLGRLSGASSPRLPSPRAASPRRGTADPLSPTRTGSILGKAGSNLPDHPGGETAQTPRLRSGSGSVVGADV